MVKNVKDSKLLACFNSLEERDKDIVITMTESLVEKYGNNTLQITGRLIKEKGEFQNGN